jgi:hypothetical protein
MLNWIGPSFGVILGLAHGFYVYKCISHSNPLADKPDHLRGIYYAIWVLGLWVLMGTNVLVLWIVGLLFYIIFKAGR